MKLRPAALSSLLLGASLAACAPPSEQGSASARGAASVETRALPLNGTPVFIEDAGRACRPQERTKITEALGAARDVLLLQRRTVEQCLAQAFLSGTNGVTPEDIAARLAEYMPTRIACLDLGDANGRAHFGLSHEEISLDDQYVAETTLASLAGTIVHEVAHNKGWTHAWRGALDTSNTVPYQAGTCVQTILEKGGYTPDRRSRDALPDATTLAAFGKSSGVFVSDDSHCPDAKLAHGLRVHQDDWGTSGVELHCRQADGAGATRSPYVGTSSGTRFVDLQCPAGLLATSLEASGGRLWLGCRSPLELREGRETFAGWASAAVEGDTFSGYAWRSCPKGMAMTSVRARHLWSLDQLQLSCQRLDASATPRETVLPAASENHHSFYPASHTLSKCPGNGVLWAPIGEFDSYGLARLGGACSAMGATDRNLLAPSFVEGAGPFARSREEETIINKRCNPNESVVGLDLWDDERGFRALETVCADTSEWKAGGGTKRFLGREGRPGGTKVSRHCAPGAFMTGWRTESEGSITTPAGQHVAVTYIQPVCRTF